MRAGEAKLRGRVRQGILNAGVKFVEMFGSGGDFMFSHLLLDAWTLREKSTRACYIHGVYVGKCHLYAICMDFKHLDRLFVAS